EVEEMFNETACFMAQTKETTVHDDYDPYDDMCDGHDISERLLVMIGISSYRLCNGPRSGIHPHSLC
ncbi:hypothetical protein Tco_0471922, partial [Tanacetum coccineum]